MQVSSSSEYGTVNIKGRWKQTNCFNKTKTIKTINGFKACEEISALRPSLSEAVPPKSAGPSEVTNDLRVRQLNTLEDGVRDFLDVRLL